MSSSETADLKLSELRALEHLKHGVKHGQHDHLALHQLASVQDRSLRISDYLVKFFDGK